MITVCARKCCAEPENGLGYDDPSESDLYLDQHFGIVVSDLDEANELLTGRWRCSRPIHW